MKSKGLLRLENRIDWFCDDIEFANIIAKNIHLLQGNTTIFKGVTQNSSPSLYRRSNKPKSRTLVAQHLKKTIFVSYIKELYEEVSEYLQYILICGARCPIDHARLLGESNKITIDSNTLLSAGSYFKIQEMVMSLTFQALCAKKNKTIEIIKGVINKLGLNVDPSIIKAAVTYLELRHFYVHSDGKPDNKFKEEHSDIKMKNGRIALSKNLLLNARNKIIKLVENIDYEMIAKNYIPKEEMQP